MKRQKQFERLDKILANSGCGTRKAVFRLVRSGAVCVDGAVVTQPQMHVDVDSSAISVNGTPLSVHVQRTVMLNKPAGTVCSRKDGSHPTVYDLLPPELGHSLSGAALDSVGRLDVDTEGLLLFTTDGDLNHFLTAPKRHVPKTYEVHLRENPLPQDRDRYKSQLSMGLHVAGDGHDGAVDCLPAMLEWNEAQEAVCRLTVYEGRFHEIKRMFRALGNEVVYLKRLSVNGLSLDPSLAPGEFRELSAEEVELLWKPGPACIQCG